MHKNTKFEKHFLLSVPTPEQPGNTRWSLAGEQSEEPERNTVQLCLMELRATYGHKTIKGS